MRNQSALTVLLLVRLPARIDCMGGAASSHIHSRQPSLTDSRGDMTSSSGALADRPRLVDKKDGRSKIWNYFGYIADSEGKPTDTKTSLQNMF